MAVARSEDQMFFIYDHTSIKSETDDLKDAIVYFFPSSVGVDDQCALVGQLMGMVEFFKSFTGSPPTIFTLQRNKVAIKHLGKYTLALAGNRGEPDSIVLTQLHYLHKLFVLYQGSLHLVEQTAIQSDSLFSEVSQDIWDCYLPFVRRYGDNVAAAFESLPVVDLPENGSTLFLKATHLLQRCQKEMGSLAGCLLHKNRVLCSQFHPDVTARLLILRPRQSHFPCIFLKTDVNPPPDVRLVKIFLTAEETDFIMGGPQAKSNSSHNVPASHNATSTPVKASTSLSQKPQTDMKKEVNKQRRGKFGSVDWSNTIQEFKTLAKDTAELSQYSEAQSPDQVSSVPDVEVDSPMAAVLSPTGIPIHKSRSVSEIQSKLEVPPPQVTSSTDRSSDQKSSEGSGVSYGRQVSQESNILHVDNEVVADPSPVNACVQNAASRSNSAPGSKPLKYQSKAQVSGIGNTVSLIQNIKRIAAQSRNILEDINKKMDLNSDMKDSDDENDTLAARYESVQQSDIAEVAVAEECTEQLGSDLEQTTHDNATQESKDISIPSLEELSCADDKDHDHASDVFSGSDMTVISSLDSPKSPENVGETVNVKSLRIPAPIDEEFEHLSGDHESFPESQTSFDNSDHRDSETEDIRKSSVDSGESLRSAPEEPSFESDSTTDLFSKDLYIQSGGELLMVLMMEKDHMKDGQLVNNMWKNYAPQLKEMENQLHLISEAMANKKEVPTKYNYLTYNSYTKNLSGKISMTRGMLQPMSHHELDFCGTAVTLHQEFSHNKELVDMTLRSHSSFVYGHRNLSQEMYFQPKECKPPAGIPSARDTTMCLDARTGLGLLRDQGIHLI